MILRIMKFIKGYVKIMIMGYSPERFLNLCNVQGILIWGAENRNDTYEMYVSVKDYKRMRSLVRKTRTKIILLEKHGLPFFLYKYRKRKMFFLGMFLCAATIYGMSLFIWNIHLEGNVSQSSEELLGYLEELGVSHGILKSKVICEEIESKLRSRYPNMLWVSAEMRGTRIIIQIKENTDKDIVLKMEESKEEAFSLAAPCDGIVESVIVRKGTPLVVAGEMVKKDQILVAGYYELKNDAGEIIRYEKTSADADIILRVSEAYADQFSKEYESKIYTGKKRLALSLYIFDRKYDFSPKIPYVIYDRVIQKHDFRVTENFYLPFSMELLWYLEYGTKAVDYTTDEIRELTKSRFLQKYENILQKGVQIIEKDVKINTNGKLCRVAGTVVWGVPVNTKVPAVIPETANNASLEGEN